MTGDGTALAVRWRTHAALPPQDLRLEFEINRASLFGFRLGPAAIE